MKTVSLARSTMATTAARADTILSMRGMLTRADARQAGLTLREPGPTIRQPGGPYGPAWKTEAKAGLVRARGVPCVGRVVPPRWARSMRWPQRSQERWLPRP